MNIAVFIKSTTFHSGYGGLETQNKVLCEGLASRNNKVTVFSPKKELNKEAETLNGVNYIFVPSVFKMGKFFGFFGESDPNNWINRSYEYFTKSHEVSKFDVVIAQSSSGLGIIKKKSEHKVPVISISHGSVLSEYTTYIKEINFLNPKNWYRILSNTGFVLKNFFQRQREFVHGSNMLVAVSNNVKRSIIDETFVQDEKVVVIHNGVDPNLIFKSKHTNEIPQLVYVGRIEKSKGIQLLLEVLAKGSLSSLKLNIIGGGPFENELKKISKDLKLDDRVTFVGKIPHEEVMHKLAESDIFVLPTMRIEGFPMVLVEAMFAELPVLASDIGGNSDAVINNETGFLLEAGNAQDLSTKLENLLSDKSQILRLGKNASKKAQNEFTINVMIEKYLEVIERVTH